jgi:hypothetical protein
MGNNIKIIQKKILHALKGKIDDFYLAGGTALSLFYLHHRESEDLDFFTQEFDAARVMEIINFLKRDMKKKIDLVSENLSAKTADIMIYNLEFAENSFLKIDFVQDVLRLINQPQAIEGIKILSKEDIYLRKIYAVSGTRIGADRIGRNEFAGGRQEAKDLFDLYFLSKEVLRLADFVDKYCEPTYKEGIIRWFRTFDHTEMKSGLADMKTDKNIEFLDVDRHLCSEIEKILSREVRFQ